VQVRKITSENPGTVKYIHPPPFRTKVKFPIEIVEQPQNPLQYISPLTLTVSGQMLFEQMPYFLYATTIHIVTLLHNTQLGTTTNKPANTTD
jgi:hypothetical protein